LLKSLLEAMRANKTTSKALFRISSIAAAAMLLESAGYALAPGGGGGEGGAQGGGGMSGILLLVVIFGIMYFLLIRPQQKRQKDVKQMQGNLKVGDRVTTTGGIHGKIAAVSDTTVSLKVAEKVTIEVDRNAIAGIRSGETSASD